MGNACLRIGNLVPPFPSAAHLVFVGEASPVQSVYVCVCVEGADGGIKLLKMQCFSQWNG